MLRTDGTRGFRRAALATACAVLAQGCSVAFVRPPPPDPTGESPGCTESRAAPIADFIVAGAALAFSAAALQAALGPGTPGEKPGWMLPAFGATVALAAVASSYHGFHETSRCREAVTSWCALRDCGEPDAPR